MINKFRDIDFIKSVREMLERVTALEGLYGKVNLTICGGEFSNFSHDIDLNGGSFKEENENV